MVVTDGKIDLDSGVAKVEGVIADADEGGLKAAADETGSMPMERRLVRIPS
jgi:hypothetical protein